MKEWRSRIASVLAALTVAGGTAIAQGSGPTITGRVLTDAGTPLPSASVSIPTLGVGAYTDDQGTYRFTVPAARANGQTVTIMARRVGYAPKSASVRLTSSGQITQDFALAATSTQLTGVVVTALGVSRPKSELGTSQQQLTGEELNTTHDQNVINQLAGKVSGVNITGSGTQGGSTKIVIRGASSITGNNDPLFIVDGQPISNYDRGGSPNGGGLGGASNDFGSAINDINPDDIASISVLKGPNAAALYGSRAANGVVLITTKRGQANAGRVATQINSSYTWDTPSTLPQWQNLYGQGSAGQFRFVDGSGGGVQDFNDQSYGPRLDGRTMGCTYKGRVAVGAPTPYNQSSPCTQFTSPADANGNLLPVPWVAHPNNVDGFFQTGTTFDNNIAFSGGTDRATARLSLGSENTNGIIPNNTLQKFTGNLAGTLNVSSRLTTTANVQYIKNTGHNRAGVGYNTGILEGLYVWFGRQVDMNALKDYSVHPVETQAWGTTCNDQYNWNCNYHNNPYWIQYQNPEQDNRDRVIASGSATWKITNWLNATGRTGTDYFRFNTDQDYATGNLNFTDLAYNGAFNNFNNRNMENTSDLLLTANGKPNQWLQLNATLGSGMDYRHYASNNIQTDALVAPDIYNASNSAKPLTVTQYDSRQQINSVYGSGSFTMRDIWTVEVTGRNDWSSTLPKGNNSYFYPSINSSIVLSDLIPGVKNRIINYAKIRGAIAQVGNDAGPYQLFTTYAGNANKFGSLPQYTLSDTYQNPNLKPEQTHSSEAGLELGMLDNRVTFDASVYFKSTRNEIISLPVASETGFNSVSVNAGRMDNHGIEALLTVVPIRSQNFQWTSTFNYAANKNKLISLYPGLQTYVLGSTWTVNTEARVGQPYGAIFGNGFLRDSTGELILSGGLPQLDPNRRVVGNIEPKWVGGWNNEIRWKNLTASALLDFHRGGNIFSVTNMFGQETGVFKETLRGREVDWNNPGILVHGIDQKTGKENTIRVTSEDYFQSNFENAEWNTYDDSYVKLRELRVGLDLPSSITNALRATNVNLAFVGRNLWTHTKVPNIDPEFTYGTGNYQGAEFAALPTTRSLGLNLRITP